MTVPVVDTNEWYPITLPSKGYYYGGKIPDGKIWITPWTTVHEEMMAKIPENSSVDLVEAMTRSNVKLPECFNSEDLLLSDQYFILLQLRIISLCSSFTYEYVCAHCEEKGMSNVMLNELQVAVPDDSYPTEPISVKLPKSKKSLGLRLSRVLDDRKAREYSSQGGGSENVFRWARQIETVDGKVEKFDDRRTLVSKLPLADIRAMEKALAKAATGIIMVTEVKCPKCEKISYVSIPQNASFFRPFDEDFGRETVTA